MLKKFLEAKRSTKRAISVIYDCVAISAALYLSYALRLGDFSFQPDHKSALLLAITLIISIACFVKLGLYRAILRYMPYRALTSVLIGLVASSVALSSAGFFLNAFVPRSVPIIYIFVGMFFIGAPRMMVRAIVNLLYPIKEHKKVIIYGAGTHGTQLANALHQHNEYRACAFIDDHKQLQGSTIGGVRVYPPRKIERLIQKHHAQKILLAIPSVDQRKDAIHRIKRAQVPIETIPSVSELISGKAPIEQLRHIEIEDLLGREPVKPIPALLKANITDKVVMVTGAGGSIGSELCRQIAKNAPQKLILFELNEFNLYQIEQELLGEHPNLELVALLGSVQHMQRVENVLKEHKVNTLYHAAAYKHVPLIEKNIIEGVRNNLFGTWFCAQAAGNTGIESFVLISTDKAVRPTNIMGATKRLAELSVQSLVEKYPKTTFSMVRFGNVLGSSGSVVPKFKQQIAAGGPITVTHPEVTRYFMTIPEAAQLVIQAGAMAEGGDVFVLEMGEPVKIYDLAKEMIRLSGKKLTTDSPTENPEDSINIEFTGLRPGEKLYEELLVGSNVYGTQHSRIMRAHEFKASSKHMEDLIKKLNKASKENNFNLIKEILRVAPIYYQPTHKLEHNHTKLSIVKY